MGHIRSYSISDAYARYLRTRGRTVLFSIGFDAFGLPTEIGAIKNQLTPNEWVEQCRVRMREQFDRLGYSFDWEREWVTSEPELYKWTQWLFLLLLREGLVYHSEGQVDWCDNCKTVLASLQVEDGACWRCHEPTRLVERSQWYLGDQRATWRRTSAGWSCSAAGTPPPSAPSGRCSAASTASSSTARRSTARS